MHLISLDRFLLTITPLSCTYVMCYTEQRQPTCRRRKTMDDLVQVHAFLPRDLKRRAFSALARREQRFTHWLRDGLEAWLQEVEGQQDQHGAMKEDHGMPTCTMAQVSFAAPFLARSTAPAPVAAIGVPFRPGGRSDSRQ